MQSILTCARMAAVPSGHPPLRLASDLLFKVRAEVDALVGHRRVECDVAVSRAIAICAGPHADPAHDLVAVEGSGDLAVFRTAVSRTAEGAAAERRPVHPLGFNWGAEWPLHRVGNDRGKKDLEQASGLHDLDACGPARFEASKFDGFKVTQEQYGHWLDWVSFNRDACCRDEARIGQTDRCHRERP